MLALRFVGDSPAQIATTILVREGTSTIWRVCWEDEDEAAVTPDNAWKRIVTMGGAELVAKTVISGLSTCNDISFAALTIPNPGEIDPNASTPQRIVAFMVVEYDWAGSSMDSALSTPFSLEKVIGWPLDT
jgi:hypothetical protein